MSFPSGPPGGYPGQPPQQPVPGYGAPAHAPRPNPFAALGLPSMLALAVFVLGLASYFCGYTSDAINLNIQITLLLVGGLLAGLHVLPKAPKALPFGAVLSTVGGLSMLATVIQSSGGGTTVTGPNGQTETVGGGSVPTIWIIILILGLLQFLVSVGALLLDYEIIKLAPRAAVPYLPQGTYPPPGQYGTPAPQHQPAAPQQQPGATQYGQPAAPPQPQSTMFLQQPGQITQQQPGTPPSGFTAPQ